MQQFSYLGFPPKRRFGVEFEVSNNLTKQKLGEAVRDYESIYKNSSRKRFVRVTSGPEGWAQTKDNAFWHVKFDRTCGPKGKDVDHGWEVASYIGSGVDDLHHIARLSRFLSTVGAETNLNCGLHIHVEVNDFTSDQMGVLLSRWLKIEHILISICHPSRSNNEYCRPLRKVFESRLQLNSYIERSLIMAEPPVLWELLRPLDFSLHNNQEKRVTLNTVGFAIGQKTPNYSRSTVELRLPECIMDEIHVRNWIRLIVNFIDTSKEQSQSSMSLSPVETVNEALMYLGLSGDNQFAFLDSELISLKSWFLGKILSCQQNTLLQKQAKEQLEFMTLS